MADYITAGAEWSIPSWGSGQNATLLSRITKVSAALAVAADSHDVTQDSATIADNLAGLRAWSVRVDAQAHTVPKIGNFGKITVAGATPYILHLKGWTMRLETPVHDITVVPSGTAPTFRSYRPDYMRVSGRFMCGISADNALTLPTAANTVVGSLATATFTYGNGGTPETLATKVNIGPMGVQVGRGQEAMVVYEYVGTGTLTSAGTAPLFAAGAVTGPLWTAGGSITGALVLATLTGSRTLTGTDSFWRAIEISSSVDGVISVGIDIQGCGDLTPA